MNMLYHYHRHQHARKKAKKPTTTIDRLMNVAAFASPLMGVPQVVQIFTTEDAAGLSLFSWLAFAMIAVVFLLYAMAHNIRPLVIAQSLWLVVYGGVVGGILIYR
jgi:MtN3 and saliva related transmembrane protein